MAENYKIIVKDARVHSDTGYAEVDLVARKEAANSKVDGPVRTYGIDAAALQSVYEGSVQNWLAAMKGQHLTHAGHHEEMRDELMQFRGKEI